MSRRRRPYGAVRNMETGAVVPITQRQVHDALEQMRVAALLEKRARLKLEAHWWVRLGKLVRAIPGAPKPARATQAEQFAAAQEPA